MALLWSAPRARSRQHRLHPHGVLECSARTRVTGPM